MKYVEIWVKVIEIKNIGIKIDFIYFYINQMKQILNGYFQVGEVNDKIFFYFYKFYNMYDSVLLFN